MVHQITNQVFFFLIVPSLFKQLMRASQIVVCQTTWQVNAAKSYTGAAYIKQQHVCHISR